MIILEYAITQKLMQPFQIMLSSFTNLAVDRVLHLLVENGYNNFVRIGSVKAISKSLHSFVPKTGDSYSESTTRNKTVADISRVFLVGRIHLNNSITSMFILSTW